MASTKYHYIFFIRVLHKSKGKMTANECLEITTLITATMKKNSEIVKCKVHGSLKHAVSYQSKFHESVLADCACVDCPSNI